MGSAPCLYSETDTCNQCVPGFVFMSWEAQPRAARNPRGLTTTFTAYNDLPTYHNNSKLLARISNVTPLHPSFLLVGAKLVSQKRLAQ